MRNKQWLFIALIVVLSWWIAGVCQGQTIQESMERHVEALVSSGEVVAFNTVTTPRSECPPGFNCRTRERFLSFTNLALGAFQFGGAAFDTKTTMDVFSLEGVHTVVRDGRTLSLTVTAFEVSGPEERFIRKGTGAFAGYKAAFNVPIWVGSHYLRKSDKLWVRVVGWTLPIGFGFVQWKAGFGNRALYLDTRSQLGY